MNIHEHQAKDLLKEFGAPVSKGFVITSLKDVEDLKDRLEENKEYVVKAQIHAGGRGKAGGVKLTKNKLETLENIKNMFNKVLITHQTGPSGKIVKRVYIEESSNIDKEFYISCLVDRQNSSITFISSSAGGMDIEKVASEKPEQIKFPEESFYENLLSGQEIGSTP